MPDSKKPIALEDRAQSADARLFSPSAARNRAPIVETFRSLLPTAGAVLEVGAGTGEHAVALAETLPGLTWIPTDPDPASRASIAAWTAFRGLNTVAAPRELDVREPVWGVEDQAPFIAIVSINMIHIALWTATQGLFAGAGRLLAPGGRLVLYGPFSENGRHSAESNAAFDASLKARDPAWGVRDLIDLDGLALIHGLERFARIEMPANNLTLGYERRRD